MRYEWKRKLAGVLCGAMLLTEPGISSFGAAFSDTSDKEEKLIVDWTWKQADPDLRYCDAHSRWELLLTDLTDREREDLTATVKEHLPKRIEAYIYQEQEETASSSHAKRKPASPDHAKEEAEIETAATDSEAADDAFKENGDGAGEASESDSQTDSKTESGNYILPSEIDRNNTKKKFVGIYWNLSGLEQAVNAASEKPEDADMETEAPETAETGKTAELGETGEAEEIEETKETKETKETEEELEKLEFDSEEEEARYYNSFGPGTDGKSGVSEGDDGTFAYTIHAGLREGYALSFDAERLFITLLFEEETEEAAASEEEYDDFLVEGVSPDWATVNLFDYWLEYESSASDVPMQDFWGTFDQNGATGEHEKKNEIWKTGINAGHPLIFKFAGNEYGDWNEWIVDGRQEIVQNKLGQDGFPKLNLDPIVLKNHPKFSDRAEKATESLAYLFDPEIPVLYGEHEKNEKRPYKKSYENVKGLFQVDDNGNYHFSSHENYAVFQETDESESVTDRAATKSDGSFLLYNKAGVVPGGTSPFGQFFPFNKASEVFDLATDSNGKRELIVKNKEKKPGGLTSQDARMNHYFGLTLDVEFMQPVGGLVSAGQEARPMVFEFAGDDDTWIFIDGILVSDLGGVHNKINTRIDFSTGDIMESQEESKDGRGFRRPYKLKDKFKEGGNDLKGFDGDIFAANTKHKLQVFYLERGNSDSNLVLSFNLLEPKTNKVLKINENGLPVEGAEFALYQADSKYQFDETKAPLLSGLTTDEKGGVSLNQTSVSGEVIDLSQHKYYVLRETKTPKGYRGVGDIHLYLSSDELTDEKSEKGADAEAEEGTDAAEDGTGAAGGSDNVLKGSNLLLVDNRFETGAVSNVSVSVLQAGDLKYGDPMGGGALEEKVPTEDARKGLILGVPLMKNEGGAAGAPDGKEAVKWAPLFGSRLEGFYFVDPKSGENVDMRSAILQAAIIQNWLKFSSQTANYYESWHLDYDQAGQVFSGELENLPGDVQQYYWVNHDVAKSQLTMAYYLLTEEALDALTKNAGDEKAGSTKTSAEGKDDLHGKEDAADTKLDKLSAALEQIIKGKGGFAGKDPEERTELLHKSVGELISRIWGDKEVPEENDGQFRLLDISGFSRQFYANIVIPNIRQKLVVKKVDEDGNPLSGAAFAIYGSKEDAQNKTNELSGIRKTDGNGLLIFAPDPENEDDFEGIEATASRAQMLFETPAAGEDPKTYYLQEVSPPDGYQPYQKEPEPIPVQVTREGVFADAGTADDGVSVSAGIGVLVQSMIPYASEGNVDITLRDILAVPKVQDSGKNGGGFGADRWATDSSVEPPELRLHFGLDSALLDYGVHTEDGAEESPGAGKRPYFETETGYLRTAVTQAYEAHNGDPADEWANSLAKKTDLRTTDINALFSGSQIVMVTNKKEDKKDPPDPVDPPDPIDPPDPVDPPDPTDPVDPPSPENPDKPHGGGSGGGGGGNGGGGGGSKPAPVPEKIEDSSPPVPWYKLPTMGDTQFGPGFVNERKSELKLPEECRREIIPLLKGLHAQNGDLQGWLTVPGTVFGYPVMHSGEEPYYYQHHTFDRMPDEVGIPFCGPYSDADSMNVLIHGHNMRDVSQFGYIWNYTDPAFRAANPVIDFKTIYDAEGSYEVMAVFFAPQYQKDETGVFHWYQYIGDMNQSQFEYYVREAKQRSLYDTGVTASYGDKLITLETCASSVDSTRLVVVARKKAAAVKAK